MEGRSRRNNIRIIGLPESVEGPRPTAFFSEMLSEIMGEQILPSPPELDRAHHALIAKPKQGERPRAVIVHFPRYQIKEAVIQEARKRRGSLQYRGKPIAIYDDYSPEVLEQRAQYRFFSPSMLDGSFKSWSDKGITCFKDLFIDNLFASFEQLTLRFGFTKSDFFRVLQIRHYVKSLVLDFPVIPSENPLDNFLSCNILAKGSISIIYNLMTNLASSSLENIKRAWEEDLDT